MAKLNDDGRWTINRPLLQLRRGDIDFAAFYAMTQADWRKMAEKMHRRVKHRLTGSIDLDDILQEMVSSVPKSVEIYDVQAGSMTLGSFVVWRAFAAAKDHVNRQCGMYKWRSNSQARAPLPLASGACVSHVNGRPITVAHDELSIADMIAFEADQDWAVEVRECRAAICETLLDHVVMERLVEDGASVQAIAESLYENINLRRKFKFGTKEIAYGAVRRVTKRFIERAANI